MDFNKNSDLKPEEMFGGFAPDSEDVFQSVEADETVLHDAPASSEHGVEQDIHEPKVVKIEPLKVEPVSYPKLRKSPWPYISAAVVLLIIISASFWFIYSNLSLSFINKFGLTELQKSELQTNNSNDKSAVPETIPTLDSSVIKSNAEDVKNFEHQSVTNINKDINKIDEFSIKKTLEKQIQVTENIQKSENNLKKQELDKNEFDKHTEPIKIDQKPGRQINANRGVYALEIYSTPSYQDAKLWLGKMSKRNLSASIVPQKIRDQIVYKVRLGNFSTEEEARKTAINMGLSRSSIDRIR